MTLTNLEKGALLVGMICILACVLGMIILCSMSIVGLHTNDNCVGAWNSPDSMTYVVFNPDGTGYIKSDNVSTFVWTKLPSRNSNNFGLDYTFSIRIVDTKSVVTGIIYGTNSNIMYWDNNMLYMKIKR